MHIDRPAYLDNWYSQDKIKRPDGKRTRVLYAVKLGLNEKGEQLYWSGSIHNPEGNVKLYAKEGQAKTVCTRLSKDLSYTREWDKWRSVLTYPVCCVVEVSI